MKIESKFEIGDKVKIKPFGVDGVILSFWVKRKDLLMIEIRYFLNNDIKTEYFCEDEIEKIKKQKTGF